MAAKLQVKNFLSVTYAHKLGYILFCVHLLVGIIYNNVVFGDYCEHFGTGKCVCTDEYVECHDETAIASTNITNFIGNIKDHVTRITITGSDLAELRQNIFGSCLGLTELVLQRLKTVDLSDNGIKTIHGKSFHCMPHLTNLTLRNNEWQLDRHATHVGYFTSVPSLKHLDLTNAFEEMWNGSYHIPNLVHVLNVTNLTHLETLSLASNEFYSFGSGAGASLCEMTALKTLNLSNNYLNNPELKDCMTNLATLDLSHNKMPIVHEDLRRVIDNLHSLEDVRLDHNPFHCDCGLVDTYRWLQQTEAPINKNELRCSTGYHSSYINKAVISLNESDLKCQLIPQPSSKAASVVVGLIFAIIGCAIIAFVIINRKKLTHFMGNCRKKTSGFSLRPHAGYSSVREVATVENL